MKHKPIHDSRFFFATAPMSCPYLPGRVERRLVTELVGRDAPVLHDGLSLAGFRRSHNIAYAPACPSCQACVAVRVCADDFEPSRSHRRIMRRNVGLEVREVEPLSTTEQYALFADYQDSRHAGSDMARMDYQDYRALIEDTPVETTLAEFREADGRLVAACLTDYVEDGLSAVYSFFDPALERQSLGSHMILWMIERARELGRRHVYLGFWIEGCSKMSYKAKFPPLEAWTPEGWKRFEPVQADAPGGAGD